jgi:predicted nucleic acid-binding protein
MPGWGWILLIVGVLVLIVIAFLVWQRQRSKGLRQQFGPEYERTITEREDRREAEAELLARQRRREELHIQPLDRSARDRYASRWQAIQAQFVDRPVDSVRQADQLIATVMQERGYPIEDFDQRAADISVDHPAVVENYRTAHSISLAVDQQEASTEDLRQAMVHYRALFDELLAEEAGPEEARQ